MQLRIMPSEAEAGAYLHTLFQTLSSYPRNFCVLANGIDFYTSNVQLPFVELLQHVHNKALLF